MMFRRTESNPDKFWQEYEEKTGEKVLARSLGKYISGWEEFDNNKWNSIWGLVIATSGGFRFHHFPQQSWLEIFTQFSGREAPKEKTIFIQKEKIISAVLIRESRWWKKIFNPASPQLLVDYRDEAGNERQLIMEADYNVGDQKTVNLAEMLTPSDVP